MRYVTVIVPLKIDWEPFYSIPDEMPGAPDVQIGTRVTVLFAGRKYLAVVSSADVRPSVEMSKIRPVLGIDADIAPVSPEEFELWHFVSEYYMCSTGEVYKAASSSMKLKGGLKCDEGGIADSFSPGFALSPAQNTAICEIRQAFLSRKPVLLQGVTGSGKTEIYMTLAIDTMRAGRNVLYLIPEIAVSRQLEDRLGKVFGSALLVFHSGKTAARRAEIAAKVRNRRYIVLGTRSALFLPHENLGLVIVDEEHDTSYKQSDPAPRYNGRDTALMLARIHGADAVLGSATPSLESIYNCTSGRMVKVNLTDRYYGSEDADVEIIDTLAERRKHGMSGCFSFKLSDRIRNVLKEGGQVLILRTRRSYSTSVQCSSCGHILKCPHCNVPLNWHKDRNLLMCHYCGRKVAFDGKCPECGGLLKPLGAGTQKVEEEASELFPGARIARLDGDVALSARETASVIRDFSMRRTDILIGTQMISKGFDFEGLELVAAIQSDSLLGQQDFRADERAVQILEQFRGRCGRRGQRGHFVIQTAQPGHPVYAHFREKGLDSDENTLTDNMLAERKMFGYPPFSRIVEIRLKDRNEARLEKLSGELASVLMSSFGIGMAGFVQADAGPVMVTGPYVPVIDKVNDHYQRNIRLSFKRDGRLASGKKRLGCLVRAFETERSWIGHVTIDVDPM